MRCWRPEVRSSGRLCAVAALGLGALLPGCGNEREEFREKELNPLVRRVSDERATLAAVLRASRPGRARDAEALRGQLGRLASLLRRVAALKPPEGTEAKFQRYTRANAALLAALRAFVDEFTGGSAAGQRAAGERVRVALDSARRAQTQLQHALR